MGMALLGWSARAGGAAVVVGLDKEKSPKESRREPISPKELSWLVICDSSVSPSLEDEV